MKLTSHVARRIGVAAAAASAANHIPTVALARAEQTRPGRPCLA